MNFISRQSNSNWKALPPNHIFILIFEIPTMETLKNSEKNQKKKDKKSRENHWKGKNLPRKKVIINEIIKIMLKKIHN